MDDPGDQVAALTDAARALDEADVPYALIGGIAVGIHSSSPRATVDVDFAVASNVTRDDAVVALEAVGFETRGRFEHSLNLRHPNGEPVQLAFDPSFDPMIDRAEVIEIAGMQVRIVAKGDLIQMKQRAAQDPARRKSKALRDQADVELLRGDVPDPDEGW